MTPAKRAKELGAKSLTQVSHFTGKSLQTLTNWFHDSPALFDAVVVGVVEILKGDL